jgi:hypothetical protein
LGFASFFGAAVELVGVCRKIVSVVKRCRRFGMGMGVDSGSRACDCDEGTELMSPMSDGSVAGIMREGVNGLAESITPGESVMRCSCMIESLDISTLRREPPLRKLPYLASAVVVVSDIVDEAFEPPP